MTHNTITVSFYTSLAAGLIGGLFLFIWWAKKVWKRIANTKTRSSNAMAMRVLFYTFPGLVMFILLCIPCFYFNHLLKQEEYCKQMIEVNKGIKRDDPLIQERCSCLDLDEFFKNQQK
jgi:hypothetical protein